LVVRSEGAVRDYGAKQHMRRSHIVQPRIANTLRIGDDVFDRENISTLCRASNTIFTPFFSLHTRLVSQATFSSNSEIRNIDITAYSFQNCCNRYKIFLGLLGAGS
jgi:hypothetical protein